MLDASGGFDFSTILTTRYAEMDLNGKLSVSNLFRYFEAARWESASATARFLQDTPTRPGRMVVRSQRLRLFEPVGPGETLRFSVWVEQVGNSSMLIGQDATQVASGRTLAQAAVLVVQTDAEGRPQAFEPPARRLINTRGLQGPSRLAAPQDNAPFSWDYLVSLSDLDVLQHMNHARYVALADDTWVHAVNAGVISDRVGEVPAGANFGSVPSRTAVQQLTIEYFQESLLGQHLKIGAWQVAAEVPTVGVEGRRTAEEKPVFRAELVLAPILEPFSLASLQS